MCVYDICADYWLVDKELLSTLLEVRIWSCKLRELLSFNRFAGLNYVPLLKQEERFALRSLAV